MANEKMMILKMLEEGKINAEEAARLMEAASDDQERAAKMSVEEKRARMSNAGSFEDGGPTPVNNRRNDFGRGGQEGSYNQNQYHGNQYSQNQHSGPSTGGNSGSQGLGLDDFANDLGMKFDTFAKDMEPRLQKLAETVAEKTANMAEAISKSLNSPSGGYRGPAPSFSGNVKNSFEKNFELKVEAGYCELNLSGLNGDIMVNGYNGDKITAKVYYRPKVHGASIELMKLGDKYYLNYDEDAFEFVAIDAYVPESLFKDIKLETVNGSAYVSTIAAEYFTINAINSRTELKNIHARNIKADCGNGPVTLLNITGENASIELFNGNINATSLDISNLKLSSSNGPVNINIDYFKLYNNYTWVLDASNGKFVMNLPSAHDLGYHIKAQTSLNNVKLGLSGMNHIINNSNIVEAQSTDFDNAQRKVKIKAETSNAPLVIN